MSFGVLCDGQMHHFLGVVWNFGPLYIYICVKFKIRLTSHSWKASPTNLNHPQKTSVRRGAYEGFMIKLGSQQQFYIVIL